jgi:hypothetical protein
MGKLSFASWVQLRENQQVVEIQVAKFLEDILEKATNLKKQDTQTQPFTTYVHQVWPKSAVDNGEFVLPGNFPPDIAGRRVQFKLKQGHNAADTIHNNGRFEGFVINVQPFDYAQSAEEVDQHLEKLKSAMHHEAEHIYNIGSEYDANEHPGDEKHRMAIQYMNNPGEIRAHARQMAYIYNKQFPGQPFDLEKAKSILSHPGLTNTHKNYFKNFSKPEIWQKSVEKYDLKHPNPHDQIVSLVPQFLSQYQA